MIDSRDSRDFARHLHFPTVHDDVELLYTYIYNIYILYAYLVMIVCVQDKIEYHGARKTKGKGNKVSLAIF